MTGRLLAVLLTAGFTGGMWGLMLRGWRGRQRRQADLPAPPTAPAVRAPVVVGAVPGLFVGTTFVDDWLDRVAVHALSDRAAGWLRVDADGVHLEREGLPELYLPFGLLVSAAPDDALAGKYVGAGGLLALTWRLGGRTLVSGFRATDHREHARLAAEISSRLPVAAASQPPTPSADQEAS